MAWLNEALRDGNARERLGRSFVEAKRLLDTTSVPDLLGSVLGAESRGRMILGSAEVDHVGFLAPPRSEALIADQAERAGFSAGRITFPSVLLARELAERTGCTLPTTVVKHFGHTPQGRRVAVEVFVTDYAARQVRRWIAQGVGMHVAIEVGDRATFAEALVVLPREGLSMPSFTNGRPHFIEKEDVTLAYFDLAGRAGSLRLEVRVKGAHTGRRRAARAAVDDRKDRARNPERNARSGRR
jgi:hypothetical protein